MTTFLDRTGVTSNATSDRYLWTDAFALLNLLVLDDLHPDVDHMRNAHSLVEDVHNTLGRHRPDDDRSGWISGMSPKAGSRHPTAGGLRIGKELPERPPDEPLDRRDEWDRDGQYFHYNTKWALALDRLAARTEEATFNRWARELMATSCDGFVYRDQFSDELRMYWKMRIDLSEPLVESMGQLDPLDGVVTCLELGRTARQIDAVEANESASNDDVADSMLGEQTDTLSHMLEPRDWRTADPLGLGGVLMQGVRMSHLDGATLEETSDHMRLDALVDAVAAGLEQYDESHRLNAPASQRLAFRELGLAIGLTLFESLPDDAIERDAADNDVTEYFGLRDRILDFWSDASNRDNDTWRDHRNINEVMLASAWLTPEVFEYNRPEGS